MFSPPVGKDKADTAKEFLQELSAIGEEAVRKKIVDSKWPVPSTWHDQETQYLKHLTSNVINAGGITHLTGNLFHFLALHNIITINDAPIFKAPDSALAYAYSAEVYHAAIRIALSLNIDINAVDTHPFFQQPALCHAIAFDNVLIAKALIVEGRHHIDLNRTSIMPIWAATPLILAIQRGHKDIIELLSEQPNIDLSKPDTKGLTPLHWAAIMLDFETLQLLVKKGAKLNVANSDGMLARDYLFPELNSTDYLNKITFNLDIPKTSRDFNDTNAPELRSIIAHFNNNREAFIAYLSNAIDHNQRKQCLDILPMIVNENKICSQDGIDYDTLKSRVLTEAIKRMQSTFYGDKEIEVALKGIEDKGNTVFSYCIRPEILSIVIETKAQLKQIDTEINKHKNDIRPRMP